VLSQEGQKERVGFELEVGVVPEQILVLNEGAWVLQAGAVPQARWAQLEGPTGFREGFPVPQRPLYLFG